jgi:DNA-directed RNA polymerase subunit RPC12/RpoP
LRKYWYVKCQHCSISNSLRRENHHLIFRSEAPKHKNIHNIRNILFVCIKCHNEFHKNNSIRKQYIIDRKLWELFPEYVKKEFYIDL